jgi:hypothetical protein
LKRCPPELVVLSRCALQRSLSKIRFAKRSLLLYFLGVVLAFDTTTTD